MKPLHITLKNYKRYGDEETTLDLSNNGVTVISGKMGVGKTSFVDAIIWSLYGKCLCSADGVVNRITKKNCKVEFSFLVDKDEYSVIRYRKHDEYKNGVLLFKNKKNITGADTQKTQEIIENIIGISYRALISSVIFSSEIYISFLRSKGYAERLKILENILNLGIVNQWMDNAKKLVKPIEEKIEEYDNKIEKINVTITTLEENIQDYKDKSKTRLLELKNKKTGLEEEVKQLKNKIEELSKIDIDKEIEEVNKFKTIKEKNEFTNKKIIEEEKNIHDTLTLEKEIDSLKKYLSTLKNVDVDQEKKKILDFNKISEENRDINNSIENLKLQIKNVKTLENDLNKKNKDLSITEEEIESIEHKNSCPLCGQEIDKEKTEQLLCLKTGTKQKLLSEIEEIQKDILGLKENNDKIEEQLNNLRTRIKEVPENSKYTLDELSELKENASKKESEIREKESTLLNNKESNSRTIRRINDLKMEILEEGSIPERSYDFLSNLKNELSKLKDSLIKKETELSTVSDSAKSIYDKSYVDEMQEKIKKLIVAREKTGESLSKKLDEKKYYDFFIEMFANKEGGIKKEIIGRMISAFNNKVNYYIPYFMPADRNGIKIVFDNNLKETITENDQEVEYNSFSSGEKTVLEISVAFSLFMLAKEFFSSSISFIVFDEILDGNLDDEASSKVAKVVSDLGENNCVMLISHRRDLKESFNNHVLIDKNSKGFSYIKNQL